jgi:hypothetical protein
MKILSWLALLLTAAPLAAQSSSGLDNMSLADTKAKDPAVVAAQRLAVAERALIKAQKFAAAGAEDPKQARKAEKEAQRAEREATAAIGGDPALFRAYAVRGQARLVLGEGDGAREDCLRVVGYEPGNVEALLCYGRASLLSDDGAQALAAYSKLTETGGAADAATGFLAELKGWIRAHPDDAKAKDAANWLAERGLEVAQGDGS